MSAPFSVTMTVNPREDIDAEASIMLEAMGIIIRDNLQWMTDHRAAGIDVPCCAKCAGVKYVPPTQQEHRNGRVCIDGASSLLARKCGACGSIVAYDVAARLLNGKEAWPEVSPLPDGSYHATLGTPEGTKDPSAAMERGAFCTCG